MDTNEFFVRSPNDFNHDPYSISHRHNNIRYNDYLNGQYGISDKNRIMQTGLNTEFCYYKTGQAFLSSSNPNLNVSINNIPYANTIQQSSCYKLFIVSINQTLLNQYLKFEIYITSNVTTDFQPFLMYKNDSVPYLYQKTYFAWGTSSNSTYDTDGYSYKKTYQYIIVQLTNISPNTLLYFTFYQFQDNFYNLQYTTQVSASNTKPCPRNCSSNGKCSSDGICLCYQPYIDEDCSIKAYQILYSDYTTQISLPYTWIYYYFFNSESTGNSILNVKKDSGSLYILISSQDDNSISYLPNSTNALNTYNFTNIQTQLQVNVLPASQTNNQKKIIIGLYNPSTQTITVSAKLDLVEAEDTTKATVMYVLIAVAAFLIVVWGVITIIKYRVYRNNQQILHQQIANRQAARSTLTIEEIDNYFPKKKFSEFKTTLEVTCCSICLEDFTPDVICRQIICEHIYHDNCIESWLSQHETCPNCKKNVTKEEIEKWIKESKNPKPDQKSPISNNPNIISPNLNIEIATIIVESHQIDQDPNTISSKKVPDNNQVINEPKEEKINKDVEEVKQDKIEESKEGEENVGENNDDNNNKVQIKLEVDNVNHDNKDMELNDISTNKKIDDIHPCI